MAANELAANLSRKSASLLALAERYEQLRRPGLAEHLEAVLRELDALREEVVDAPGIQKGSNAPEPGDDDVLDPLHFRTFALDRSSLQTLESALVRAGEIAGSRTSSSMLGLIALDFLATSEFKKGSLELLQRFLIRLEKALGIRLLAVRGPDHEIVYGYRLLESIVGKEKAAQVFADLPCADEEGTLLGDSHPF